MFEYQYMQNAFWAIIIITPLFGLVGTMIVNNKLAFFSDALGHSALTGIAIGALLGVMNPTLSMVIFGIVFALLLNRIKDLQISSRDTIISVFSSTALALGLVILSYNGNFTKFSNYLILIAMIVAFSFSIYSSINANPYALGDVPFRTLATVFMYLSIFAPMVFVGFFGVSYNAKNWREQNN